VKPIAIIGISVVCSVVAVIAVQSLSGVDFSEVDVGESVANIIPFDCAKGWDDMRANLRHVDNDAFQKLSKEDQREIRKHEGLIMDEFHANWCYLNHEEWEGRAEDRDGRLVEWFGVDYNARWQNAIATEFEYNEKFPDGAYQDW